MKKIYLILSVWILSVQLHAQKNVGIGTNSPGSTLQVNGSIGAQWSNKTANYTLTASDYFVSYSGTSAGTFSLPQSLVTSGTNYNFVGRIYILKNASTSYTLTVSAYTGELIDGSASISVAPGNTVTIMNNGSTGSVTTWNVVGTSTASGSASGWGTTGNSGTTPSTSGIGTSANNNFIGTTDAKDLVLTTNDLERLRIASGGNVGIGNKTPAANLDINGNTNVTSGYYYGGINDPVNFEVERDLPNTVGNCIDIGNFTLTNGAHNLRISVTISNTGFSVSKTYLIPVYNNATANVYQQLVPQTNTGAYSGNDFATDINVNNSVVYLRLRRTAGTTDGSSASGTGARVRIESVGSTTDVFAASTSTTSPAAPTTFFTPTTYSSVPSGLIAMWSGTYANIPGGWALCDGTNGTPNLLNYFVMGVANSPYSSGDINVTGGSNSHTLAISELPNHVHTGTTDASAPTLSFAGTAVTITPSVTGASYTPAGNISVTGASYTPAGNVAVTGASYTPAGNVTVANASYTPAGNVTVTGAPYTPAGNVAVTGAAYTPAGNIAVTGAAYTPAGNVSVANASYTPAGNISVTGAAYTPAGNVSVANASYTPAGNISVTGASYTPSGNLSLSFSGNSVTTSTESSHTHNFSYQTVNGWRGYASAYDGDNETTGSGYATGNGTTSAGTGHNHSVTASGNVSGSFSGNAATITPSASFSGSAATISHTATFSGTAATISPTAAFSGAAATISHTATFSGTAATISPTAAFTGTAATINHTAAFTGTATTISPTAAFNGTAATISHTATFSGTAATISPTAAFSGTAATISPTAAFSGTAATITPSIANINYTPAGNVSGSSHTHTFTTSGTTGATNTAIDIRPAFYRLAYIMKL